MRNLPRRQSPGSGERAENRRSPSDLHRAAALPVQRRLTQWRGRAINEEARCRNERFRHHCDCGLPRIPESREFEIGVEARRAYETTYGITLQFCFTLRVACSST